MEEQAFLQDFLVTLVSCAAVALVMQRIRMAAIPGYLIVGAIIGPNAMRWIQSPESMDAMSHLALILLLFGIGMQLHLSALRRNWLQIVGASAASMLLFVLAAWPVGMIFGLSQAGALVAAMGLSLSSTAVVLRIIAERRELRLGSSRLALGILVFQDIAVIFMLVALPAMAGWHSGAVSPEARPFDWAEALLAVGKRLGAVVAVVGLSWFVLPIILKESAKRASSEVIIIVSVSAALLASMATFRVGFSLELGAFLAGLALSGSHFRHHITTQIAPLRDLFIALFFSTLGMRVNLGSLPDTWWIILLAGALMSALKAGSIGISAWSFGAAASVSVAAGLALAQAGEFSIILFGAARDLELLGDVQTDALITMVVISLVITPAMITTGRRWSSRTRNVRPAPWIQAPAAVDRIEAEGEAEASGVPATQTNSVQARVIIGGFGPVGRMIAARLDTHGITYSVIEMNALTVEKESKGGLEIVYGDVGNAEALVAAGLGEAEALLLTIPDEESVERACLAARLMAPSLYIGARFATVASGERAKKLHIDAITVEEIAAAEMMGRLVVAALQPPPTP